MKKIKSVMLYTLLYSLLTLLNFVPLIIFKDSAKISVYSIPSVLVLIAVSITAVISYFLRHQDNYLVYRRHRSIFSGERDYTYSEEYERRFRLMLVIYCIPIPFYLPVIFFARSYMHSLWSLLLYAIPQIAFMVMEICDTVKDVKDAKMKRLDEKRERREQEMREELGRWK